MKKELISIFNYDSDLILDNSYPLNIFNLQIIYTITLIFRFKKYRHALILATILLLHLIYLFKPSILLLNYTSKSMNIEKRDFAGIQHKSIKSINIYILILIYTYFKEVPLIDDVLLYNKLYLFSLKIRNYFKKKFEQKKKIYSTSFSLLYFKKNFKLEFFNYFSLVRFDQFYLSMRNIISIFYILFDWSIFYYLFDKDLYNEEYGASFQMKVDKYIWIHYRKLYISSIFLFDVNYII